MGDDFCAFIHLRNMKPLRNIIPVAAKLNQFHQEAHRVWTGTASVLGLQVAVQC